MTIYPSCTKFAVAFKFFIVISFVLTSILGVLLHYAYDFSGKLTWVSLFSPINESTWEHLKLLFFPLLIVSVTGFLILYSNISSDDFASRFFTGNLYGVLAGMAFTVTAFYTLSGILGRSSAVINIAIFFVAVLVEHIILFNYVLSPQISGSSLLPVWVSLFIWGGLTALFIIFTFVRPDIGLFADPLEF